MMNSKYYYPVCLDLSGRNCLVVGGGVIAERKTCGLLEADARITLVSPQITEGIRALAQKEKICWIEELYDSRFLAGMVLAVAATNIVEVNQRIFEDCVQGNIQVNVVDDPVRCTFIVPAILRQGDIQVAVSTGGSAPVLAGKIRDRISEMLGDQYQAFAVALKELRPRIRLLPQEIRKQYWNQMRGISLQQYENRASEIFGLLEQELIAKEKAAAAQEGN